MIFKVEQVGGRARVTTDEKRVLREGWRDIKIESCPKTNISLLTTFVTIKSRK